MIYSVALIKEMTQINDVIQTYCKSESNNCKLGRLDNFYNAGFVTLSSLTCEKL